MFKASHRYAIDCHERALAPRGRGFSIYFKTMVLSDLLDPAQGGAAEKAVADDADILFA